jgi:hypothetical protein
MGEVKCTLLQIFDLLKPTPSNYKWLKPTPSSSCKPLKLAPSLNCKLFVYWKLVVCKCFVEKEKLWGFKTTLNYSQSSQEIMYVGVEKTSRLSMSTKHCVHWCWQDFGCPQSCRQSIISVDVSTINFFEVILMLLKKSDWLMLVKFVV